MSRGAFINRAPGAPQALYGGVFAVTRLRPMELTTILPRARNPVLKKSRWLLLRRADDLDNEQHFRLRDLLRYNLKAVRAYLLKETSQQLWDYNSAA